MPRRRAAPAVHACECAACRSGEDPSTGSEHYRMNLFLSRLDEPQRRWYAALEAKRIGHGGDQYIAQVTGLSVKTIRRGRRELDANLRDCPVDRLRQPGGGRPPVEVRDPAPENALDAIVVPETAGDPQSAAKYKRSSLRHLSARLREQEHPVSRTTVGRLLKKRGYSLRVNARRKEAKSSPPERDEQFRYIAQRKQEFMASGDPVISVDTKKRS
jgi:Rhodopirellula transposase DDE domain